MRIAGFCRDCAYYDEPRCKIHMITGLEETFYCANFRGVYEDSINGRIKSLLDFHPKTQERTTRCALAEHLGVTPQHVSMWAAGKRTPGVKYIPSIAKYFGVSCDWLLCGDSDNDERMRMED
jgi:DNA-binding XRE family transcriptional regulator